jgi:hypothetical protein
MYKVALFSLVKLTFNGIGNLVVVSSVLSHPEFLQFILSIHKLYNHKCIYQSGLSI